MSPPKDEALHAVAAVQGSRDCQQDSHLHSAVEADPPQWARLKAEFALRGYALLNLAIGGFLVSRHDRTLYCPDLRAATAAFARLTGIGA